jgi:hypothetical protein
LDGFTFLIAATNNKISKPEVLEKSLETLHSAAQRTLLIMRHLVKRVEYKDTTLNPKLRTCQAVTLNSPDILLS